MSTKQAEGWGLTVLRIVVGLVFVVHGAQKLFVYGWSGVTGMFGHLGIPAPAVSAAVVIAAEFLGGLALILGVFTRFAARALAINMAVAILAVHLRGGFFLPNGYEYALSLLGANIALALAGPGAASVDGLLAARKN